MWVDVGFSITYPKAFSQHLMSKNTQDECDPPSLLKKKVVTLNFNSTVTILGINPQYGRVQKLWETPTVTSSSSCPYCSCHFGVNTQFSDSRIYHINLRLPIILRCSSHHMPMILWIKSPVGNQY
jgi:hypothetical protein